MPHRPIVSRLWPIINTIFLLIICSAGTLYGDDMSRSYNLEILAGDTTGSSGEQNSALSIYLKNYTDTVAGFNLWIQLSRPDIMEFQTSLELINYDVYYIYTAWDPGDPPIPTDSVVASPTWVCTNWNPSDECIDSVNLLGYYQCINYSDPICIDSIFIEWIDGVDPVYTTLKEAYVGNIDTVGTLISGWEMVTTRSLTGNGQDMLITAFADQAGPPPDTRTHGIGFPQYSTKPLIKILGDIFPMDDTVTNRTASVRIEASIIDYFGFSDHNGNSIGVTSEYIDYKTYFMCDVWLIPDVQCFYWSRVMESECPQPEGCDSTHTESILYGSLDVDECCDPVGDSCLTRIEEWQCPGLFEETGVWHNGSIKIGYGSITVLRGTCGEIDGSDGINILDVVYLINYKYKGGPVPDDLAMADVDNCSGDVNILDVVYIINYKYKNGPSPVCCGK